MAEYSISQLKQFEECALQYKFIYVDRIKRYEEGVEAFLGQRFHEAMEWLYHELAFRVAPLDELLAYYEKRWAETWNDEVKIRKSGRTQDEYRLMGRRFIEDYYKRYQPFDAGRVVGLERYIRFPLDDAGRYRCKGIIDRLMLAPDGAFEVHDYKTGSGLPDQAEADDDCQLALYEVGVRRLWPDAREVRLIWHYVAFDAEIRSARTPEALDKLKAELGALIDRIEAETEFAPREGPLCDWCAYGDLCPGKKHLFKVEALPRECWQDEPGVKIVDAYADLWRKKKGLEIEIHALDAELDGLRQAAIDFAAREGACVIAGTDARLRVTEKDRICPPAKGTTEREALEGELRALGLWDEVSTLDPPALEKAFADERFTPEILARLTAYLVSEKRYTVTLKEGV